MQRGVRFTIRFKREVKLPRFQMAKGELWDKWTDTEAGREFLELLERGEDRFPFGGGYCFFKDVERLTRAEQKKRDKELANGLRGR